MPVPITNEYTIRTLLLTTYQYKRNRLEYMKRDVLSTIQIQRVSVYDGKQPGQARTKYVVRSFSYPQYAPYFTKTDSRGRPRTKQRTYKHQYDVTIQLDKLSIDVPVKLRTGAAKAWDFGPRGKATKGANGRITEGTNVLRGLNGDFFFRLSNLYAEKGVLFGRDFTNGPATRTNPQRIMFLDKHAIRVITILMERGILSTGGIDPQDTEQGVTHED